MSTTSSTPASPANRTLKLCSHAINGGCRLGDACPNVHPLDPGTARAEFDVKKTLNLCGFYPDCARPGCTFLHVAPAPRTAAPAPLTRAPPAGKTPSRTSAGPAPPGVSARAGAKARAPARSGEPKSLAPAGGRGGPKGQSRGPRKAPAQKESGRAEPEALRVLHKIRGKINALERTRLAYETLAKEVKSVEGQEKADQAQCMQDLILEQLTQFAGSIDAYLLLLGATLDPEEDTPSDEEPPASPGDSALAGDGSTA